MKLAVKMRAEIEVVLDDDPSSSPMIGTVFEMARGKIRELNSGKNTTYVMVDDMTICRVSIRNATIEDEEP